MARFVLDQREVSTCGHFKDECYKSYWGKYHYAIDYHAEYVPGYAWTRLFIEKEYWGNEGGNWMELRDESGNRFRIAHLKEYKVKSGVWVNEGTLIFITGNSGRRMNAAGQIVPYKPHLHFELRTNGQLADPEIYFDKLLTPKPMSDYNDKIIRQSEKEKPDEGGFALVVRGKKFILGSNAPAEVTPEMKSWIASQVAMLLIFFDREPGKTFDAEILNVDYKTWESIPTTNSLAFK